MDDVQYDKRFTNRNKIIATNGWTWLTVPINKTQKFLPNNQIEINNKSSWKDLHWKKIHFSYSGSKYFHLYKDYFQRLYNKEWNYLFDLDLETIKQVMHWLGIKTKIIKESELNVEGSSTERLVNVCKSVGADTYISGLGVKGYMNEKLFEKNNIKVQYQNYNQHIYQQHLAKSFIPNLSIIDLLCNMGSDSMRLITGELTLPYTT